MNGIIQLIYEPLNWKDTPFNYQNNEIVKIPVTGDSSSLLHAIASSYLKPYRTKRFDDGTPLNRENFINNLRINLADKLSQPTDSTIANSPTYYDHIMNKPQIQPNGYIKNNNSGNKYTLEMLQNILKSNSPIGKLFFEYISDVLKLDLYFISDDKKDIQIIDNIDEHSLHKGRDSVVLLIKNNHFDLVGLYNSVTGIKTLFSADHDFITSIRTRIQEIKSASELKK